VTDTVAAMGTTIDRRTGWLVVALAATVFMILAATVSSPPADEAAVLRRLVERTASTRRGDYTLSERTSRVVAGVGTTAAVERTVWVAAPRHLAVHSGDLIVVTTPDAVITCRRETPITCLPPAAPPDGRSDALPYLAAVTTGRYSIADAGRTTVVGEAVECFALTARSSALVLAGLGEHLTVCVTRDGLVLRSERREGRVVDRREAVALDRSVSAADRAQIAAAVRTATG